MDQKEQHVFRSDCSQRSVNRPALGRQLQQQRRKVVLGDTSLELGEAAFAYVSVMNKRAVRPAQHPPDVKQIIVRERGKPSHDRDLAPLGSGIGRA